MRPPLSAAIDQYLLPAGPTAANPPHAAAVGKWDRQTDTIPFHRPCPAYYAGSDNKCYVLGYATM